MCFNYWDTRYLLFDLFSPVSSKSNGIISSIYWMTLGTEPDPWAVLTQRLFLCTPPLEEFKNCTQYHRYIDRHRYIYVFLYKEFLDAGKHICLNHIQCNHNGSPWIRDLRSRVSINVKNRSVNFSKSFSITSLEQPIPSRISELTSYTWDSKKH